MLNKLCCFRLRTAAIIVGCLEFVCSLITLGFVSYGLGNTETFAVIFFESTKHFGTEETTQTVVTIVCVVSLVLSAVNLVTSVLLILGTVKERHLLVLPWVIYAGFSLALTIIYYVVLNIIHITSYASIELILFSLIASCVVSVIYSYIWYAMYSHYKQLQRAREQEQEMFSPTTATSFPGYNKM